MALIVKDNGGKDFKILDPGLYQAVCSHIVDMGEHDGQYGVKSKVGIVFELADVRDDGNRYQLWLTQGNTLASKGHLRPILESWRGKKFTEEELKDGFDLEKLLGVNCYLNLTHDSREGKTYLKINSVNPLPKAIERIKSNAIPVPKWIVEQANLGLALRAKIVKETVPANETSKPSASAEDGDLPF